MAMKKTLKTKWLKALRSGKFVQGIGSLEEIKDGVIKHCCLGVLCVITKVDNSRESRSSITKFGPQEDYGHIHEELRKEFGLTFDVSRTLADMNDHGKSFKQIVAYISRNL